MDERVEEYLSYIPFYDLIIWIMHSNLANVFIFVIIEAIVVVLLFLIFKWSPRLECYKSSIYFVAEHHTAPSSC